LSVGIGTPGPDLSYMEGRLCQDYVPAERQLSNYIGRWGASAGGGYFRGGGVSISENGPVAVQQGWTTPGFSGATGWAWQLW
jgi:hypothetical protein